MFDDQIKDSGQVPGNLPLSEPADIFAGTEEEKIEEAITPIGVPKVLGRESALGKGILRPKQVETPLPVVEKPSPTYSVLSEQVKEEAENLPLAKQDTYVIKGPTVTRWLLIAIIVIVIIGFVGVGGMWAYNKFFASPAIEKNVQPVDLGVDQGTSVVSNEDSANAGSQVSEDTSVSTSPTDISSSVKEDQVLFGEPIDKDGDGLDDNSEKEIGTDSNNWDTDEDGLSDGDEVNIWHTDPLKADTDGDGYLDGAEVKNGYNPMGPGKLFQVPTTTS